MRKISRKGFTLIELLAVIVILGILMMILIPAVSSLIENARKDTFESSARAMITAVRREFVVNGSIGNVSLPATGLSVSVPLYDSTGDPIISLEQGGLESPYGEQFHESSYVSVTESNGDYVYSICLIDNKGNGTSATDGTEPEAVNEKTLSRDNFKTGLSPIDCTPTP